MTVYVRVAWPSPLQRVFYLAHPGNVIPISILLILIVAAKQLMKNLVVGIAC